MKYQIIDNFLDLDFYKQISHSIKSDSIPWFSRKHDTTNNLKNKNGFFSFNFYNNNEPGHPSFHTIAIPILKKLNYIAPISVRANLTFRDIDSEESGFHIDDNTCLQSTTAILFLTTCDAQTVLKIKNKELKIESVENRMLVFNSQIPHKLIYHKNVHKRHVINLNYFGDKI